MKLVWVIAVFAFLFGCEEEKKVAVQRKQTPDAAAAIDENSTEEEEEEEDSSESAPNPRRERFDPSIASPINNQNVREYIERYFGLLKTSTREKPITILQKFQVARNVDSGNFIKMFPDDQNEHVFLQIGTPIVAEELNKETTYLSPRAFAKWKAASEAEQAALVHLFVENLIAELHKMNGPNN
jgi:hypothetical protein